MELTKLERKYSEMISVRLNECLSILDKLNDESSKVALSAALSAALVFIRPFYESLEEENKDVVWTILKDKLNEWENEQ